MQIFGQKYGSWLYGFLCAIVFIDTGLVFSPLLPGNSLIFTAGVLAANGVLSPHLVLILLSLAAFLGDHANYWVGRKVGHQLFGNPAVANYKSRATSTIQIFSHDTIDQPLFLHIFPSVTWKLSFYCRRNQSGLSTLYNPVSDWFLYMGDNSGNSKTFPGEITCHF